MYFLRYRCFELKDFLKNFLFLNEIDLKTFIVDATIVDIFIEVSTVGGKKRFLDFVLKNKVYISDIIKKEELCKTIPFFDKGWSKKILKAKKEKDLEFLLDNKEFLKIFLMKCFVSLDDFLDFMNKSKENLEDEASILNKEEFDSAILEELKNFLKK